MVGEEVKKMALRKREPAQVEETEKAPVEVVHPFDRLFEDWTGWLTNFPFHRPFWSDRPSLSAQMIRVDEYQEDGVLVVKAELPGIDPDEDVELTVSDSMLRIAAERREEDKTEHEGYRRHEIRSGSFSRTLPLPAGVSEADITAKYENGILEIRIPAPQAGAAKKIPIEKI